ncbi:hypothetical protein FSST1_009848 [Fusarium sambucinum]
MAVMLCAECTAFKETLESLTEHSSEGVHRAQFRNFAALEKSSFMGCTLCQIIHQTWHHKRYSKRYKKDPLINVAAYRRNYGTWTREIFIDHEGSIFCGFSLADFKHSEVGEEQFSQYQTAWREIARISSPDRIGQIIPLASMWIRNCRQDHQNCISYYARRETKVIPTRLIDVGADDPGRPPSLFIPLPHQDSMEYIALSYAWGSGHFIKTTSSNLEAMKQHLPWTQLPKTIQDAIIVTRRLGVRYLWVDALCILQSEGPGDMKHKEDWSYETARFGKYYENALLTIAATGASSSDQGLFSPSPISRLEPQSFTFRSEHHMDCTVRSMIPSWLSEIISGPLSYRGWAMQERLLSRRVLHFAENMILWECHDCRATGHDPEGMNPRGPDDDTYLFKEFMAKCRDLYAKRLQPSDFMDEWYQFVSLYSKCHFTFVADRLPALSGITAMIQQHTQQRYVAGLWESDISQGLAWHSYGAFRFDTSHLVNPQIPVDPAKDHSQMMLPSWSWAACEGAVFYPRYDGWRSLVEVESCQVNSQGSNTSGQLRSARLTLRGVLAMINLNDLGFEPYTNTDMPDNVLTRYPDKGFLTEECVCMDSRMDSQLRHASHPCLLLGYVDELDADQAGALILKATGQCIGLVKEYRRIGYISLAMHEFSSLFTDKETTISMI